MAAEPQLPIFGRTNRQSQGRARNFLGGGGSSPIVRPVQNITRINQQKRPETLPTRRFGKATGVDAYNFLSNPKVSKAIRKSLTRLKDVMLQSFTVAKLLRVSLSNIFNQIKGFGKKAAGGLAGIGIVGLLGAIGYGLYKFFEPKIREVIDKILEFKKKIEDFANTVKEKIEGFVEGVKERFKEIKNTLIGWYNNITGAINNALGFTGLNIPSIQQEGMSNLGENYRAEEQAAIQRAQEFRESGEIKDDIPEEPGFFGTIGKALGDGFNAITGRGAPTRPPAAQPTTPIMGSGSSTASPPKAVANDQPFQQGVSRLAKKYNVSEDDLYAVMSFETGGTFDPAQKNAAGSGATGLIQFMPETAKGLGTTVEELAKMSRTQQLEYVDKYFSNKGIQGGDIDDLYMSILFPAAVGKPDDFVLFGRGAMRGYTGRAYDQNRGLDANNDGSITKAEAAAKARTHKRQPAVQPVGNQSSVPRRSSNIATINTQSPQASVPRQPSRVSSTPQSSESGPTIAFLSPSNPDAFASLATKAELNIVAS